MNLLNRFTIIVLAFLSVSCSSSWVKVNSLTNDSKEGVAIGKIKILLNGTNVTTNSILSFNGNAWSTDMLQIENEDYFLIKLPHGENHLEAVFSKLSEKHRGIRYFFPEEQYTFHIDRAKINYIGDITLTWTGPDEGPAMGFAGPLSAYIVTTTSTGKADISTENNINNVVNFLNDKFPSDTYEINISLLGGEIGQVVQEDEIHNVEQIEQIEQEGPVEQIDRVGNIEKKEQIKTQQNNTENNIEKRLLYLKKLFEKKIITKKEYEEKRKEIIDEI